MGLHLARHTRSTAAFCIAAALVLGCGTESGPSSSPDSSSPSSPRPSDASPLTESPGSSAGISVEQLRDLPPTDEEIADLLGIEKEKVRSESNDGVSQVLEGVEPSETLEYVGYSYTAGNPRRGGDFAAVGLLLMVGTEPEIQELFVDLTYDGDELPDGARFAPVEVDGATEAATSFKDLPSEGFAIDATVVRREQLMLFLTLLSPTGGSTRQEASVGIAEKVLANSRASTGAGVSPGG